MFDHEELNEAVKLKLRSMHVNATIGGVAIDFASLFAKVDAVLPGLVKTLTPFLPANFQVVVNVLAEVISVVDSNLNPAPATPAAS